MSGYIPPSDSASTLTVWLGYVNTNVSVSLTGPVITVTPGDGFEFMASDAGVAQIQVLGAGAAGAPLWTTITSYTSATTAGLAAAGAAVSGAQAVIYRPVAGDGLAQPRYIENGSIEFEAALTTNPTLRFTVYSADGSFIPVPFQPVLLTDSSLTTNPFGGQSGDIFGGSIEQARPVNIPGTGAIVTQCECTSWTKILTRRVLGNAGAFPVSTTTIDRNGGQIQNLWTAVYGETRFFNLGLPAPLTIESMTVNGVTQDIGPFSALPPPVSVINHPGLGGHAWYWSPPDNQVYEDNSGRTMTDADSVVFTVTTIQPQVPTIFYASMTADVIANALLAFVQQSEGITMTNVVAGPLVNSLSFSGDQSLDSALSSLTTYVNDSANTFWYYIDPRKGFHFEIEASPAAAPWNIEESDGSDGNVLVQVQNTATKEKFANAAYISSSEFLQQLTEPISGNGSALNFELTYPVGSQPTILLCAGLSSNNPPRSVPARYSFGGNWYPQPQTVGVIGQTGFNFYWAPGSQQIQEDPGSPAIPSTTVLYVTYQPQAGLIQSYVPPSGAVGAGTPAAIAAIEGGSGQYDTTIDIANELPFVQSGGPAISATEYVAQTIADYYSQVANELQVQTYRSGLAPGQSITVNLPGIFVGTMVVQSVKLTDEHKLQLWDVTCAEGAIIGDWKTAIKYFTLGGTPTLGGYTSQGIAGGTLELNIGTAGSVTAPVGIYLEVSMFANGGLQPYLFSASGGTGLPPGLAVNPTAGLILGTPTTAGTYTVTCQVNDSQGNSATQSCSFVIQAAPGSAGAAPNVTSATVLVNYPVYDTVQHWYLSGTITLPTSGIADLAEIQVQITGPTVPTGTCTVSGTNISNISPADMTEALVGTVIQIAGTPYTVTSYVSASACTVNTAPSSGAGVAIVLGSPVTNLVLVTIAAPASGFTGGATITWQTPDLGPNAAVQTVYPTLAFACFNGAGVETASPYTISNVTVAGWQGVLGDETPNPTMTNAYPAYSVSADGVEQWQAVCVGAAPQSPNFARAQAILCATAVLAANISSGAANNTFNITVRPWQVSRTCTVGANGAISAISPSCAPGAQQAYVLVSGTFYTVSLWSSSSACQLVSGSYPSTGTGVSFSTLEFRYGGISNGDTIWIDGYEFSLNTISLNLDSSGRSTWNVTSVTAYPGITASATQYILDINSTSTGCDKWAGSLQSGATQSISGAYNIGAPACYTAIWAAQTASGQQNTWPVTGVTPGLGASFNPFGVEVQTGGSLSATRLVQTQINSVVQNWVGNSNNLASDPLFVEALAGNATYWTKLGAATFTAYYAQGSLVMAGNGQGAEGPLISCLPGQAYGIYVTASASSSAAGNCQCGFNWYTAARTSAGSTPVTFTPVVPGAIEAYTGVATSPGNAAFVQIVPGYITGSYTSGYWQVFQVDVFKPPATSGPLSLTPAGAATVTNFGISNQFLADAAVYAANMAAASITGANAALSALSGLSVAAGSNAVTVEAANVYSANGVIAGLIVGNLTVALSLTAGGAITSNQGASYVGINALGHALVASNTSTGVTSVFDDGYLSCYATLTSGGVTTAATGYFGADTVYGGVAGFESAIESISTSGSTGFAAMLVTPLLAQLTAQWTGAGENYIIQTVCYAYGCYLSIGASPRPSSPSNGTVYTDSGDGHVYIYSAGAWKQI